MTKKVVIDGVEYVPKPQVAPPQILGFSVEYEDVYASYSRMSAKYPTGITVEVRGVHGKITSVYLHGKSAEDLLEAIHK